MALLFLGTSASAAVLVQAATWIREVPMTENLHLRIDSDNALVVLNTVRSATESAVRIHVSTEGETDLSSRLLLSLDHNELHLADQQHTPLQPKLRLKIDIQAPSLPVEVHLLEGSVQLQHWQSEALLQVQSGKVNIQSSAGSVRVHMQKGELIVTDLQGKLTVDSVQASVLVRNALADLEVQNFQGETVIDKLTGAAQLSTQQGTIKALQGSGSLHFDVRKGSFISQNFVGRMEGQTQEGNVIIASNSEPDINVRTASGKVNITCPPNSGALLNLLSTEGDIFVPKELHVVREGSSRMVKARLKGEHSKGAILVRAQDGSITIK